MTPFRQVIPNTPEWRFNTAHASARNIIERCIGLLKTRFRCLLKERTARYKPHFVSELIKACSILHNMCIADHVAIREDINNDDEQPEQEMPVLIENDEGVRIRYNIVHRYFQ